MRDVALFSWPVPVTVGSAKANHARMNKYRTSKPDAVEHLVSMWGSRERNRKWMDGAAALSDLAMKRVEKFSEICECVLTLTRRVQLLVWDKHCPVRSYED